MKTRKYNFQLICAITMLVVNGTVVRGAEAPTIQWNQDANSLVLNKLELTKIGKALPAWKISQITWPSVTEISSASVMVDEKLKTSCIWWLQRFMKKEQLPVDLDKHLIAMKRWGLFRKASEQKRLCDVFLARFTKGPYVIHIQESPYNVIIAVADERLTKTTRADHQNLVIETATSFLNQALKPDLNSENFHEHVYEAGSDRHKISSVTWAIDSLITIDSAGRRTLNLSKAGEIGTTHVNAETDGRFIKFEIIKCPGAVKAAFFDPYLERFSPPK